mmetsp:Transcript_53728/g.105073  ORF Transcript_53728/g.105073 Transcript_53728/m.105073 type:complete len:108 (+) Transcript_53728:1283-1606(+)
MCTLGFIFILSTSTSCLVLWLEKNFTNKGPPGGAPLCCMSSSSQAGKQRSSLILPSFFLPYFIHPSLSQQPIRLTRPSNKFSMCMRMCMHSRLELFRPKVSSVCLTV